MSKKKTHNIKWGAATVLTGGLASPAWAIKAAAVNGENCLDAWKRHAALYAEGRRIYAAGEKVPFMANLFIRRGYRLAKKAQEQARD